MCTNILTINLIIVLQEKENKKYNEVAQHTAKEKHFFPSTTIKCSIAAKKMFKTINLTTTE